MNNSKQLGQVLSLRDIFINKKYKIEIPIIQRDYAQGRETASDIRIQFLNSIKEHLLANIPLDLDFVYGSIENPGVFVPLDGQQRITTLFLLHFYLSIHDDKYSDFKTVFTENNSSKLTYETRFSSKDFFNSFVNNPIELPSNQIKFSDEIQDAPWFSFSWLNDPTVMSVLNVLDSIHVVFNGSENLYEKIKNNNQSITFQFIELKDFGLSDSLYIKMNARGKELTYFENFKAKIEQMFDEYDKLNLTNYRIHLTSKADGKWTDFFWQYKDSNTNTFDRKIMNFFRVSLTNQILVTSNINNQQISNLVDSKKELNYYNLFDLGALTVDSILASMNELDCLIDGDNQFFHHLSDTNILNEEELFKKSIENNLSYPERIQLFSLNQFYIINSNYDGLEDWIRVIRNLTENTRIDDVDRYLACIEVVHTLFKYSSEILNFLSDPNNELKEFASIQVKEERIKALLILRDDRWHKRIKNFENHPYFQGQIGFIFDFNGIEDYYDLNKNISWNEDENNSYISKFDFYAERMNNLFNENGILDFDNFLFERSLLTIEDYLLFSKRNYTFIINGKDRDISWKRYLRDKDLKRNALKQLLDALPNLNSITDSLVKIVNQSTVKDWRKYFIEFPELIEVCGERKFIRWGDEGNDILLLLKSQTNGFHRELYSYALKLRLKKLGNQVTYVGSDSVDEDKFISIINSKPCLIKYKKVDGNYQYVIEINTISENHTTEAEVIIKLKELRIII